MKRTSLAAILAIFVASVCCCLGALPLAAGSRVLNGSEHLTKSDGSQIITVYDPQRRIVQRVLVEPDGRRYVLIDDSRGAPPVRMMRSA